MRLPLKGAKPPYEDWLRQYFYPHDVFPHLSVDWQSQCRRSPTTFIFPLWEIGHNLIPPPKLQFTRLFHNILSAFPQLRTHFSQHVIAQPIHPFPRLRNRIPLTARRTQEIHLSRIGHNSKKTAKEISAQKRKSSAACAAELNYYENETITTTEKIKNDKERREKSNYFAERRRYAANPRAASPRIAATAAGSGTAAPTSERVCEATSQFKRASCSALRPLIVRKSP